MNQATTAQATKKETTKPIARTIHLSVVMSIGLAVSPSPDLRSPTALRNSQRWRPSSSGSTAGS